MHTWKLPLDLGDILLTPQWAGLNPALQALLFAVAFLLPPALIVWLYRYEMQLVARTTAIGLLCLRVVVLALLLMLVCLQPIYGRTRTEELPGYVLVAVDRSASMELSDCKDGLTRSQAAERLLRAEDVGLLPALTKKHQVELLGFHQEAWELKLEQAEELFRAKPQAAAAFTDLRLPLARALERSAAGQGKLLGIVLLTDGQHNTGDSPTAKAQELGDRRLPIYPIALGSRKPPPDAALVSVKAPNAVFKDVDVAVEATFKITSLPPQDFLVELHRTGKDGNKKLADRIVHHQGKDRTYTESFPVRMDEAGLQTLSASVRPINPATKETRGDNNNRSTTLSVADDKARVLLIDGEARWEYHYLASALKRDRTLKVESVVFHQPRLNENLSPEVLNKIGSPRQQLPPGANGLADFDCIVLGDVGVEQLPLVERQRLEKYVGERGGTLVILAGKRFMPMAYAEITNDRRDAGSTGASDPLRKLLPIESPRAIAPLEGFSVTLTQDGRETKFLEMDANPTKSAAVWSALPRHFWAVVGKAKPAATTLAYVAERVQTKSGNEGAESALIVKQNYGFGRVLFVGLDSTWRWRYRAGDAYHHAFWGAAIRWAASDKPLMTGNDFIRFGTPQPIYSRGEEVKIVVRLNEELGPIKPNLLAAARVLQSGDAGKAVALVQLSRRPAQPRVLEGRISDLPPGDYAVELVMPDYADKLMETTGKPMRAHFTIHPPDSKEMIDLEVRWPLLEEIAAKSGGKVFTDENANELVDLLVKQSVQNVERYEQKLWQWWVMLVLVLAFLTVEWAGRKLSGLP